VVEIKTRIAVAYVWCLDDDNEGKARRRGEREKNPRYVKIHPHCRENKSTLLCSVLGCSNHITYILTVLPQTKVQSLTTLSLVTHRDAL
jgi:REP element-mobilizing transposase RayT